MRVAIVGAGIGGLATALALHRDGHEVACFERVKELREVGAGVQIAPNAARALRSLGVGDAIDRVGFRPASVVFRRWDDGRVLCRHGGSPEAETLYGAPYYTIHRADLHGVLRDALPASSIRLGARVVGVEHRSDAIELGFEDGARHLADVAVGADGLHSTLRQRFSRAPLPASTLCSFRGLVPIEKVRAPSDDIVLWLGPSRSAASYPVADRRMVSFTLVAPVPAPAAADDAKRAVLAAFAGWDDALRSLVEAADRLVVLPLYDHVPLDRWSEGRLTLLGDAAHAMLPFFAQGAAQAIEDGTALARHLRGVGPGDVQAALARYEAERRPRNDEIAQRSAANGTMLQFPDGELQEGRDRALESLTLGSYAWLFGEAA
jgi:salicylate hydroxylase